MISAIDHANIIHFARVYMFDMAIYPLQYISDNFHLCCCSKSFRLLHCTPHILLLHYVRVTWMEQLKIISLYLYFLCGLRSTIKKTSVVYNTARRCMWELLIQPWCEAKVLRNRVGHFIISGNHWLPKNETKYGTRSVDDVLWYISFFPCEQVSL